MIVDGKAIAEDVYATLEKRREGLSHAPKLGIVVCGYDSVIESFVRIKSRAATRLSVGIIREDIDANANTEAVIDAIRKLSVEVDGIIVQLPLGKEIDTNAALSTIPDDKDVDAISTATGEHHVDAPVARAIEEILTVSGVPVSGKKVAIVGAGRLVGLPTAQLLKRLGAHVSKITLEEGSLKELMDADIVISGVGEPGLIKPEHIKDGTVLIDAGTSEHSGKVVGDCDPACAAKCSVFTPVPGGVGPVSVAMIFKNLFDLTEKQSVKKSIF